MMNQVQKLKDAIDAIDDYDLETADLLCFDHLKEAAKDFGRNGGVALKLLDLAEELMK